MLTHLCYDAVFKCEIVPFLRTTNLIKNDILPKLQIIKVV